jgi:tRNA(adenine34) deaminase
MDYSDDYFMQQAFNEALKAAEEDEVPIGAVIVSQNRIIARAHNMTERLNDVTAHAEMQAFTAAADYLGGKYLDDCTLYVTVEPCIMCAGAAFWTQIHRIVFGAPDPKRGYTTITNQFNPNSELRTPNSIIHPKTTVVHGIMQKECSTLLSNYFKKKRS